MLPPGPDVAQNLVHLRAVNLRPLLRLNLTTIILSLKNSRLAIIYFTAKIAKKTLMWQRLVTENWWWIKRTFKMKITLIVCLCVTVGSQSSFCPLFCLLHLKKVDYHIVDEYCHYICFCCGFTEYLLFFLGIN